MSTSTKTIIKKLRDVSTVTCYVKRDSLKPAGFNPAIRVQLAYLKDLRASMTEEGFWEFSPLLVDRNGTIIDGHRRWTVAGLLHIEQVPVTIVDEDADALWSKYNGSRMDLTGAQALQAIANGLQTHPPKFARMIAQLEEVIGTEGVQELGNKGQSPYVINAAMRIARYCGLETDKPFIGTCVRWLSNNARMNGMVAQAIKDNSDPIYIERAVRANRPLEAAYR